MTDRLEQLRKQGVAMLPGLAPQKVQKVMAYLHSRPVYPGCHVRNGQGIGTPGPWEANLNANVVCWHHADVIRAPHLLEFALAQTDMAALHLGVETPILYSMNVFCTRPEEAVRPDIQDWHVDRDDTKFIPLFIYLTDVGFDGAQEIMLDADHVSQIVGPAGTAFFSDTMRMHRGLKPQHKERIIFWARWGVSARPPAYEWDDLHPINKSDLGDRYPTDPRLQKSLRLLVL